MYKLNLDERIETHGLINTYFDESLENLYRSIDKDKYVNHRAMADSL